MHDGTSHQFWLAEAFLYPSSSLVQFIRGAKTLFVQPHLSRTGAMGPVTQHHALLLTPELWGKVSVQYMMEKTTNVLLP